MTRAPNTDRVRSGRAWTPALLLLPWLAGAAPLDPAPDPLLARLAGALEARGVDVARNLNDRRLAGARIERPRLGRFPDLPGGAMPDSDEIGHWERSFAAGEIGGVAVLGAGAAPDGPAFLRRWLDAPAADRIFLTHHRGDGDSAGAVAAAARAEGFAVRLLSDPGELPLAGELYATAAQRLAIDSREARRLDSPVTEIDWLGRRVRRGSNSLFRDGAGRRPAGDEPAAFLKETLGDEFSASTIREIVVPGGVALGETARLPFDAAEARFDGRAMTLLDLEGGRWSLPPIEPAELKALFDFVERSEATASDAMVDIDENRRVRISAALRDTDAGHAVLEADTAPFEHVRNLPVTKSVIVDGGVGWAERGAGRLGFETDYEVRFLTADNMRIAQTFAALEYRYDSGTGEARWEGSWGPGVVRLRENLDYAGLGGDTAPVAEYAGWIGLLRRLREDGARFLHGRYEFMKIDKTGRRTPARY